MVEKAQRAHEMKRENEIERSRLQYEVIVSPAFV